MSKDTIWNYLKISRFLPKEAKESLIDRTQFGVAHAIQLLRLKDMPDKQVELAREFASSPWRTANCRSFENFVKVVHYNVQRRMPKKETAALLLKIAKMLEARGVESRTYVRLWLSFCHILSNTLGDCFIILQVFSSFAPQQLSSSNP